jgi:hypothetical protein
MALQHLRSSTANKRPVPGNMSEGQLAINSASGSPGLFFKDSNANLVKVGPVHVGTTAPNASPASGGTAGNSVGEQWLDTSGSNPVFKVWDGSAWQSQSGEFVNASGDVMTGALGIIAGSQGSPGLYFSGDANTGIYSPGADQVAISTNGTGKLFIDANGKVGVGTSAPSTNTSNNANQLVIGDNTNAAERGLTIGSTTGGSIRFNDGADAGLIEYGHASNFMRFVVNTSTEALRILSDGKVGLGTSSPGQQMVVRGSQPFLEIRDSRQGAWDQDDVFSGILFGTDDTSASTDPHAFIKAVHTRTGTGHTSSDAGLTFGTSANTSSPAVERVRITYDGKVGIGSTGPLSILDVTVGANGTRRLLVNYDDSNITIKGSNQASNPEALRLVADNIRFNTGTSGSGTEVARIDGSGRLLVGTANSTDAGSTLQVASTSFAPAQILRTGAFGASLHIGSTGAGTLLAPDALANGESTGFITFRGYDSAAWRSGATISAAADGQTWASGDCPTRLVFSTNGGAPDTSPTERMRINAAGNTSLSGGISVGGLGDPGTTIVFNGTVIGAGAGTYPLKWNSSTGAVTYDTSSALVKENIVDCPYGIEAIKQLQPRKYFRVDDQREEIGFVADEVVAVLPEYVPIGPKSVITKDEDDTEEIPLGVHYDKLTAVLTKALQEAIAKIETLEAKVAALEAS